MGTQTRNCIILRLAFWRERDGTDSQGLISVTSTKNNSKEGELREWTGVKKTPAVKVVPFVLFNTNLLMSLLSSQVPLPSRRAALSKWPLSPSCYTPAIHGRVLSISAPGSIGTHPFSATPPPSPWSRPHIPSSLLTLSGLQPCVLSLFYPQQPHQFSPNSNLPSNKKQNLPFKSALDKYLSDHLIKPFTKRRQIQVDYPTIKPEVD